MKKTILCVLVCVCTVMCGCSSAPKLKASMNMAELAAEILEESDIDSTAQVFDSSIDEYLEGTDIDKDMLADYSINSSTEGGFELLIIAETKKKKDVETVVSGLKYLEDKYRDELGRESVIVTKGNYIMLVNCAETEDAVEIFDNSIS